jgi:hypothetical protein
MAYHYLGFAAGILAAAMATACNSQSTTDPKVAELEERAIPATGHRRSCGDG